MNVINMSNMVLSQQGCDQQMLVDMLLRLKSIVYLPGDFVVKKVSAPVCACLGQGSATRCLVFALVRALRQGKRA